MDKNLYIDASHPDETRIVLKSNLTIEEYEYEDKNRLNFKNNIYLGTISRVEPSLQAAFVDFGRLKHGFLAFNDIQSDYYQIPSADLRKNRMNSIRETENKSYTSLEKIKKEVDEAKNTFRKYKWPTIDVTRKSVEETAASVIKIYEIYKENV